MSQLLLSALMAVAVFQYLCFQLYFFHAARRLLQVGGTASADRLGALRNVRNSWFELLFCFVVSGLACMGHSVTEPLNLAMLCAAVLFLVGRMCAWMAPHHATMRTLGFFLSFVPTFFLASTGTVLLVMLAMHTL